MGDPGGKLADGRQFLGPEKHLRLLFFLGDIAEGNDPADKFAFGRRHPIGAGGQQPLLPVRGLVGKLGPGRLPAGGQQLGQRREQAIQRAVDDLRFGAAGNFAGGPVAGGYGALGVSHQQAFREAFDHRGQRVFFLQVKLPLLLLGQLRMFFLGDIKGYLDNLAYRSVFRLGEGGGDDVEIFISLFNVAGQSRPAGGEGFQSGAVQAWRFLAAVNLVTAAADDLPAFGINQHLALHFVAALHLEVIIDDGNPDPGGVEDRFQFILGLLQLIDVLVEEIQHLGEGIGNNPDGVKVDKGLVVQLVVLQRGRAHDLQQMVGLVPNVGDQPLIIGGQSRQALIPARLLVLFCHGCSVYRRSTVIS